MRVGIFSLTNDLHALLVADELRARGDIAYVVEVDQLAHTGGLVWSPTNDPASGLLDRSGQWFDPALLDVVWWRRAVPAQRDLAGDDPRVAELIHHEWEYALLGSLLTRFQGWWVNDPRRVRAAENKLLQLQQAISVGLAVPPTLVSQDPAAIRAFAAEHAPVIVKAVKGSRHLSLDTVPFDPAAADDAALRICPAIYQAAVPGSRHLRINCFGDRILTIAIDTPTLDWRRNLDVPMAEFELEPALAEQLWALRRRLGVEMAIMDGKFDDQGRFVFFEANPQGQFLFAQPLAGVDLVQAFVDFLLAGRQA